MPGDLTRHKCTHTHTHYTNADPPLMEHDTRNQFMRIVFPLTIVSNAALPYNSEGTDPVRPGSHGKPNNEP